MIPTLLAAAQASAPWWQGFPAILTAVAALLTAAGAATVDFLGRRKVRAEASKTSADAAKVLSDTALELLDPYRRQVADLRAEQEAEAERVHRRMAQMQSDLEAATAEVISLRQQLAAAQHELNELRARVNRG